MNFNQIFENLVRSIEKKDKKGLVTAIDDITKFISKLMNQNFKTKNIDTESITKISQNSYMYSVGDTVYYSPELIFQTKEKILNTNKYKKNNDYYNDVIFAIHIVNGIAHELCHCKQYLEFKYRCMNKQIYLNSLSFIMYNYYQISYYLDSSHEGEAYGFGVKQMMDLINKYISNQDYLKQYMKASKNFSFLSYNTKFHEAISFLNEIPFMKSKNDNKFYDIYTYASKYIANLPSEKRMPLINEYQTIMIGIQEKNQKCRLKNPEELIFQYLNKRLIYKDSKYPLTDSATESLLSSYVYLLIPQLNENTYNNLCQKFGINNMENIMLKLYQKIDRYISIYNNAYFYSKPRINYLLQQKGDILQNIDETYAKTKYETALAYLNQYKNTITKLVPTLANEKKR